MGENEITSTALSSLGADLSVSISFSVANEFIAAAREAQMGNDELVAMLVAVVVVVTSAKRFVDSVAKRLASGAKKRVADASENRPALRSPTRHPTTREETARRMNLKVSRKDGWRARAQ